MLRKLFNNLLIVSLVIGLLCIPSTASSNNSSINDFVSQLAQALSSPNCASPTSSYGDFSLSWENINGKNLLSSAINDTANILYTYDDLGRRTTKIVNNAVTTFEYGTTPLLTDKLVLEIRNGMEITYNYSIETDSTGQTIVIPASFTLNENQYIYVLGENNSVVAILDESGSEIVRYEYQDGLILNIMSIDETGNWKDSTNDSNCLGNINRIRYNGYYFDSETNWYYSDRYYDTVGRKFVDANTDSTILTNLLLQNRAVPNEIQQQIIALAGECYTNPGFGVAMDSVSGWYSSLSDVEILARLIYGENTTYAEDQRAVAWIVVNCLYSSDAFFPNTLRSVMTQSSQFSTIAGTGSSHARAPKTTASGWSNAVSLACTVTVCVDYANGKAYLEELMTPPTGITNQVAHRSYTLFVSNTEDSNGNILLNGKAIHQVTVAGYGTYTSLDALINSNIDDITHRNIFFNFISYSG